MDRNIVEMLDALEKEPERIADFLEFGSRFYRYSLKNNLLIYRENPQAVYCQSFSAWNDTTDGVVLAPSELAITTGSPPSITATHEFVVPKSIPIIFPMIYSS